MAQGRIFLLDDDTSLTPLREEPYDSEILLQSLLADYPDLLAGDQIDGNEPRRWLLVRREQGIAAGPDSGDRWAVDHLFLDQEGIPTFVEVKRSTDTRIRREVVGQILEYAANAVHRSAATLRATVDGWCRERELSPDEVLVEKLGIEGDADTFWEKVDENLQLGRVRLILAADKISDELLKIVEFLNGQMERAEILALEVRQFVGEGRRTLVPRVLGLTAAAKEQKATPPRRAVPWTAESFLARVQSSTHPEDAVLVEALVEWARGHDLVIVGGRGSTYSQIYLGVQIGPTIHRPFYLHEGDHRALLHFWYDEMGRGFGCGEENRVEFCRRMSGIPGAGLKADGHFPSIPLQLLTDEGSRRSVLAALDWVVEQMRREPEPPVDGIDTGVATP